MMLRKSLPLLLAFVMFTGCSSAPSRDADASSAPSDEKQPTHTGAVVGGAGGALAGGAMAYSSAGILCTIGGPLCVAFVLPAAIVGGVLGLAAGSAVDAVGNAKKGEPDAKAESAPPREDTSARQGG